LIFSITQYLVQQQKIVDAALKEVFKSRGDCPSKLWESMRYSVFAGGKRLRPVLCLAAADAVGVPQKAALRIACALELIHTYSLIHDDLPALDNDDYRRGVKTNHKVYGEAMAILAGDGLQTLAFQWVSDPTQIPAKYLKNLPMVTHELAFHAGYPGMVGGQVDDILAEKQKPSLKKVYSIHSRKTGALLLSSVRLPSILVGASDKTVSAFTRYGRAAGLAFQIVDDILNATGDAKKMGKSAGSDQARGKMTYPAAVGLSASKREVTKLTQEAVAVLKPFGPQAAPLVALAQYMAERTI
jgi:geranylgeranyl diphosphate synthase type II